MTYDLKVKICVWLAIACLYGALFCMSWAIKSMRADLEGVPVMLDKVQHEINWRKL